MARRHRGKKVESGEKKEVRQRILLNEESDIEDFTAHILSWTVYLYQYTFFPKYK